MTTRARRWAMFQVRKNDRSVKEVAAEFQTDWHTVKETRGPVGEQLLKADADRVGTVQALGVHAVLFVRPGRWKHQLRSTQIFRYPERPVACVVTD